MKQLIVAIILVLSLVNPASAMNFTTKRPQITADSAILLDQRSGQILFSKNSHQKRAIASTTKVLTGILAIEKGNLNDTVEISPKAAAVGESTIHLEPNEKLTLENLLFGALLRSGNDACVAIAEHISGTEEEFVKLMNKKAVLLGAGNSHFCNTNGLPNNEHYSTAYDLALIARHALNNQTFAHIVSTKTKIIKNNDNSNKVRHLSNTNKLLWQYPWTDGVKTGTTNKAGRCLIASATKGKRSLLLVILHSEDRERDATNLFEYGFHKFETQNLMLKGEVFTEIPLEGVKIKSLSVKAREDLCVTLPISDQQKIEKKLKLNYQPELPVMKGEKLGEYSVYFSGQKIKSVDLVSSRDVTKTTKFQELVSILKEFL